MNKNKYMRELKKLIREFVNDKGKHDLKKHMEIIKEILFFISQIIFFKVKFKIKDRKELYEMSKEEFSKEFYALIEDMEVFKEKVNREKHNNFQFLDLDSELKYKIIDIINSVEKETLRKFSLGELYDYFTTGNEKKFLGQVYTPKDIVCEMIESSLKTQALLDNPYMKVIDIACGGGYFVLEAFHKIKKIMIDNYDKIIMYDKATEEELLIGIDRFILKYNIWGIDIDDFSVYMTRFSLALIDSSIKSNISKSDSLLDNDTRIRDGSFGLVITNPPYIGHKKLDSLYSMSLRERYRDVFCDKGDLSYCFFKRAYELLDYRGRLSFITSRYFLESLSGEGLRKFIKKNLTIETIIDFYGENVFKGISISPVIIECINEEDNLLETKVYKRYKNNKTSSFKENLCENFSEFSIVKENLRNSGWILLDSKHRNLFEKIDSRKDFSLHELCLFKQGIITGLDSAFIIDEIELKSGKIELDLLKPWIKNSEIEKFYLRDTKKYIIYSDNIDSEEDYPLAIEKLNLFKERLLKRRECKRGIRKWYELQWGRDENLFKGDKIMFPYKSDANKFSIVRSEICSSADVYSIVVRDEFSEQISLEYLVAFLNSSLCEYYFKCIAKKLNDKQYEYYPNKLINLNISVSDDRYEIEALVRLIEDSKEDNILLKAKTKEIDNYFYRLYELSKEEISIIESNLKGD